MHIKSFDDLRNLMFPLELKSFKSSAGDRQLLIRLNYDNDLNGAVISVAEFAYEVMPLMDQGLVRGAVLNTHDDSWLEEINSYLEHFELV